MKIFIDPGHGGHDSGAVGPGDNPVLEKEVNLSCAIYLSEELRTRGHETRLTRSNDVFVSLGGRSQMANAEGCHLFVSIHANSAESTTAEGIETFHFPGSKHGRRAADKVQSRIMKRFSGHRDRGVKSARFSVLRRTNMPAILVEMEFVSNVAQQEFLRSRGNIYMMAQAIANGIEDWGEL